jgi:hypothetical protein
MVRSQPWQIVQEALSQKYTTQNRAGGVAQEVKCLLPSIGTLSSNPSNTKIKQIKIRTCMAETMRRKYFAKTPKVQNSLRGRTEIPEIPGLVLLQKCV